MPAKGVLGSNYGNSFKSSLPKKSTLSKEKARAEDCVTETLGNGKETPGDSDKTGLKEQHGPVRSIHYMSNATSSDHASKTDKIEDEEKEETVQSLGNLAEDQTGDQASEQVAPKKKRKKKRKAYY